MNTNEGTPNLLRKRNRAGQRGQGLVEFTLVVLVLVLVMVGVIDFARLFFTYANLANAAREGARYGIIFPQNIHAGNQPDPYNITYRTSSKIIPLGDSIEPPHIEITFPDGCDHVGCRISVRVTAFFKTWTSLIPRLPIVAQAVMYIE